jgi:hypothetical protein
VGCGLVWNVGCGSIWNAGCGARRRVGIGIEECRYKASCWERRGVCVEVRKEGIAMILTSLGLLGQRSKDTTSQGCAKPLSTPGERDIGS